MGDERFWRIVITITLLIYLLVLLAMVTAMYLQQIVFNQ